MDTHGSRVEVPPRGSPSVSRAAAILNLIGQRPGGWSLTQIASDLGLAKSSTLTILNSLQAAGLVSRGDGGYELDVGVMGLAGSFLRGMDIVGQFKRHVAGLTVLSREIAHLALLAGREVIFIGRHLGRSPLPVTASVGDRFPASITSVGAALLATLSDEQVRALYAGGDFPQWTPASTSSIDQLLAKLAKTREDGYAVDDAETHPNVLGHAMVVRRVADHSEAFAVGASVLRDQTSPDKRRMVVAELRRLRQALEVGNALR